MTAVELWSFAELVRASGGRADGEPPAGSRIAGISNDSRVIGPGDVFVALRGERDGHEFVAKAFAQGAAAAIVEHSYQRQDKDGALIRVADTLQGLEGVGRGARSRLGAQARVVAVTGSAGKTTTKEMLKACLSRIGLTHAADKSFNNHIGVPLTLARMPRETTFGVLEVGMNHAGEITPLSRMVRPHVVIVTTVVPVHLEHFPSEEAIADAKAEIFSGVETGGAAILNRDNRHFQRLEQAARRAGVRVLSFGSGAECDARVATSSHDENPLDPQEIEVRLKSGRVIRFTLGIPGSHMADNAAAVVLAIVEMAGEDSVDAAIAALTDLRAGAGRGERTVLAAPGGEILLIDESYNANPVSMAAAIDTANDARPDYGGRLVLVLGDMLELGETAVDLHRGLKVAIDAAGADLVFAAGPNMRHLYEALPEAKRGAWAKTSSGIQEGLLAEVLPGDVVMIKGSNGSHMAPLVAALKERWGKV